MDLVKMWGSLLASYAGAAQVCAIPTTYFMQGVQVLAYTDASSSSVESEDARQVRETAAAAAADGDDDGEDSRPSTSVGDFEEVEGLAEGDAAPAKRRRRIQRIRYSREEYKCTTCPYTCTTEKAFMKHVRQCDSDSNSNKGDAEIIRLSCPVCGKDRDNEQTILLHMKKHRQDKHFCCDLCKFKTLQLKKLIQHRRMHTGEKPHLCPFCTYRSARRDNLRSHVRRVHKKENLTCDTFTPRNILVIPTKQVSKETKDDEKSD